MKICDGAGTKSDSIKADHTVDISCPLNILLVDFFPSSYFKNFFVEPSLDVHVFLRWMMASIIPAIVALWQMAEKKFISKRKGAPHSFLRFRRRYSTRT